MEGSAAESARLAALLPDIPRFVETRAMLLEGDCKVLGLEEDAASPSFVVRDGEADLVCVVGYPAREAIAEAVARTGNAGAVIAMPENVSRVAQAISGRDSQPAILHLLGEAERLPGAAEDEPGTFAIRAGGTAPPAAGAPNGASGGVGAGPSQGHAHGGGFRGERSGLVLLRGVGD